jgi:hemolysin activation/secretion protein
MKLLNSKNAVLILAGAVVAASVLAPMIALAQAMIGPRVYDTERPDVTPLRPVGKTEIPVPQPRIGAVDLPDVTVRDVAVAGDRLVSREALVKAVSPYAGRKLDAATLNAISTAVSDAIRANGIALYGVVVPQQSFANGVVVVQVVEGRVVDIVYTGDVDGADLTLTKAYAERLRAERPLTRATLERYLLLISDIPGRTVDSRLDLLSQPGAVRLVLTLKRTAVRFGFGVDNLGESSLGNVQASAGVTVNSLLREGDSTRLTYGAPSDFQRFSYVALRHQEAIGADGLTVALNASLLDQRQTGSSDESGASYTLGLQAVYPIVRSLTETLQAIADVDMLDSHVVVPLGPVADEATRVLRGGGAWSLSNDTQTRGGAISLLISQGIGGLGARQRVSAYGGPEFTKASLLASYQQMILDNTFILRLQANGQMADQRLPSSEFFTYGGVNLGRAFNSATLEGDRGISAAISLAMPMSTAFDVDAWAAGTGPFVGRMIRGAEVYGFVDAGYVENLPPGGKATRDRAASIGGGIALPVADQTKLNLEIAAPLVQPLSPYADRGVRFVAVFRRDF